MNPNVDMAAIAEASRRMAGLGGSSAGIPGGAQAANEPTLANPIAQQGASAAPSVSSPQGMPQVNSSEGAVSALNQALPGEAMFIIKSLTKTLDKLVPQGA